MASILLRAASTLSLILCLLSTAAAAEPVVHLERDHITYRGTTSGRVEHFHNIKYGHDTSGARRFAPPEPYVPPEGSVLDATRPGPACPQLRAALPPAFAEVPEVSEDCLNLRIARPAGTSSPAADRGPLPVVVHVYVGGLVRGNAEDPHWDPEPLLALAESMGMPIIYVALNFRLTIFGYARLPVLGGARRSLNVGMRDQRAGLQWVKDNIAAFGGDPGRITAFGISAGGTMTSLNLMAYGGEHGVPFTQAWAVSGPPGTALNISSDATEMHTRAVAERLGCGRGGDDEDVDGEQILRCLRDVPMDKLTEVAMAYSVENHPPMGLFTFIPSVDGDIIPDRQSVLYKTGRFARGIPLVYGWTQDDGATNAGPAALFPEEEDIKMSIRRFMHALTDEDYAQLFAHYPAADFEPELARYEASRGESDPVVPVHWFRASRILRDLLFTCSSIDFGHEMARRRSALPPSSSSSSSSGVYLYALNQSMLTPLFRAAGMPYVGAAPHGSDSNYLSNGVFPEGTPSDEDRVLAASLAASFVRFAHTGSPRDPDGDDGDDDAKSWPEAFPEASAEIGGGGGPSMVRVQVVGGPLGGGAVTLRRRAGAGLDGESVQSPLVGVEYGEMASPVATAREQELRRQKLLDRCAFINTLADKIDH